MSRHLFQYTQGLLPGTFTAFLSAFAVIAPPASADIAVQEVQYQTLPIEQSFEGIVEAVHRSTVSAQTSGEVVELPYDVNDFVPKGALIVRINDTRQKAELDKAAATATEARARLKEAESAHQRNLRLIEENAASKSQTDKSEANLKSARAQLESTVAALKQAREQWQYTRVEAPFDGVVVERLVELGEQVQVGTPLGAGLSLEKLRVKVPVPAAFAGAIRDSGLARVETPSGDWVNSDALTFFPFADAQSHTFTLRVRLPEGQYGMYPGMLVKVAFKVGEQQRIAIPERSIVHRSEVTGVYVVGEDQSVRLRQLRLGRKVPGKRVEVLAGLEAGERIALDPVAAVIQLKQRAGAVNE